MAISEHSHRVNSGSTVSALFGAVDEKVGIAFYGCVISRQRFKSLESLQTEKASAKRLIFYKCRCAMALFLGLFTKEIRVVLTLVYRFCGNKKIEMG